MNGELVQVEDRAGVVTIRLDSPANGNAFSHALLLQLQAAIRQTFAREDVRVVVLTAAGKHFCSGADLKELRNGKNQQNLFLVADILADLHAAPVPLIARVNGAVRGGGAGLLAACDYVIAADDVSFAFSEVRIGVAPAVIALVVVPRIGGVEAGKKFLSGERFDAREALRIGLVDTVVGPDNLDSTVEHTIDQLLAGAPKAQRAVKAMLRTLPPPTHAGFAEMADLSTTLFQSAEGQEGMAAFAEKRPPSWTL